MGETDWHRDLMAQLIDALKHWFRQASDVYVSGNLMMYYREGEPKLSVSPDVFVVKGVHKRKRRTYKLWEERKAPLVVIEITSRKTRREDMEGKFALYRDLLRIPEYYLFDPDEDYIPGALRAFRLRGKQYVEQPLRAGRIHSPELGLDLLSREEGLRLIDPATGAVLHTLEEAEDAHRQEAAARAAAEEEVRRLRAELERLRGGANGGRVKS